MFDIFEAEGPVDFHSVGQIEDSGYNEIVDFIGKNKCKKRNGNNQKKFPVHYF